MKDLAQGRSRSDAKERPVPRKRCHPRVEDQIVTFFVLQVVGSFAQDRISERSVASTSPKTKKANQRCKAVRSMDDDDFDAMLDEAIAEARKFPNEQLAELEADWKEGDPMYARCPEDTVCRTIALSAEVMFCSKCRFAARAARSQLVPLVAWASSRTHAGPMKKGFIFRSLDRLSHHPESLPM